MNKTRKPKPPVGPKGPRKPEKFSDDKIILKQFSMNVKSYKDVKQKETEEGLMLSGMPVFKSGKHREFDYSHAWIDKFLIGQFDADDDVPIQRDHSDESYATLGYVKNLYREGDMVYADMLLIDETAISRWKKGLMKKWSVGISREFRLAEISAVAFPYVKEARVHSDSEQLKKPGAIITLTPSAGSNFTIASIVTTGLGESDAFTSTCSSLTSLSTTDNTTVFEVSGSATLTFSNVNGDLSIREGDFKVEMEHLEKQIADMEASLKETQEKLTAKEAELSAKDAEIATYKKAKEDAEFAQLKASIEADVKELIKDGKVAPAREKSLVDVMSNMSEDARKEMIQTFKESGRIGALDEKGQVRVEKQTAQFKDGEGKFDFDGKVYDLNAMSAEDINDLVDAYAKKNDLGFSEAQDVIFEKARPNS